MRKIVAGVWLFAFAVVCVAEEPKVQTLELFDEVVCRVNTEAIGKRDVEDRSEGTIQLLMMRKAQEESAGTWNDNKQKEWDGLYVHEFRESLRKLVRERLVLQHCIIEKVTVDERALQKKYEETVGRLRERGVLGSKGYLPGEIQKRVRENMLMDMFRGKFANILEQPNRPDVQKYYQQNIARYQRKAGVKVRLIKIDTIVKDRVTGISKVREKAYEFAEELRRDIVDYGAKFEEVARKHTDDIEARERGGLIKLNPNDDYFEPDSYSPLLAAAIRGLKPGDPATAVSKVFNFGQSYAIALVEARREAGPAPLEGDLYQEIYQQLLGARIHRKEDEWFKKALAKSWVAHVVNGVSTQLTVDFFFPDEAEAAPAATVKPEEQAKK